MAFTLSNFAALRPYLFHLTASSHVQHLAQSRTILPTSDLLQQANQPQWLRQKRREHLNLVCQGVSIVIRDQKPLHAGNTALEGRWRFEDLIECLNGRVFFWPGTAAGQPIDYGLRHFERYEDEAPAILRVPTSDLFRANPGIQPEFCRFNSGSPRCTQGNRSPRGPDTFQACGQTTYGRSAVVEVTFPGPVRLPATTYVTRSPSGPWTVL
jgi:uncharacterized protein DUF7002